MANNVTNTPLILDTASTSEVVVSRLIWVSAIRWVLPADSAVADECLVKNKAGRTFFHSIVGDIGTATNVPVQPDTVSFDPPQPLDGVIMHTLGRGTLYIYFQESKRN